VLPATRNIVPPSWRGGKPVGNTIHSWRARPAISRRLASAIPAMRVECNFCTLDPSRLYVSHRVTCVTSSISYNRRP